jgi:TPR repeat protein
LYDEQLFKDPPSPECPICFLPLPSAVQATFFSCCGKRICSGCIYAMRETGGENLKLCPFCKATPARSPEEEVKRIKKLMEKGNAEAFYQLASHYENGIRGMPQDWATANELYLKAGELGCAVAYNNLGNSYCAGRDVEVDEKKAKHYYELSAMNGSVNARHNLGCSEGRTGNHERAMKHLMISASAGLKKSLDAVKYGFMNGDVTKDEYANTLREYQNSQDEMKSKARDKALAARNEIMGG